MNAEIRIDPDGWDPAVADTEGPQLVVAGPGAGKTEFLVRRAAHLVTAEDVG
ncbi:MAG: UvrD-helicase domain-containing protein, partial [Actinobacteria bacterium]|nr:UvrD-helicase domain-containing protein [Actinomycetota bacterium]NIS30031.1 UvrD-helicase domain-containing protein [Actinomycetota bacterium]NIT94818.1 UvrD-helicase domain-containing protein [Actinomycetota bacterium]NIU18483.1 UvrD-helicase domain-containing protein [Actinomycetota bacterium]NIU65299.1 UvrD-helicase domain-containing protein [Actinomycetota bacterium]